MVNEGEKMKKNIFAILKTIILFLLLFTFTDIVVGIFDIDVGTLSNKEKYLLGFGTEISFLIILFLAYRKTLVNDFKEFFSDFFNNFEFAFKYYLIGFLVMVISNFIIVVFTKNGIAGNEESIRSLIEVAPLYMVFSVSLYAPFTEELIFRKGFRDVFKNKFIYVLVSGITFGALHVITYISPVVQITKMNNLHTIKTIWQIRILNRIFFSNKQIWLNCISIQQNQNNHKQKY